jgi:putative restriction endonuclease
MRKAFVGVTDFDWYEFLAYRPELTEINFWQPGGRVPFRVLSPGDLFLFKLHSPNNFIVGGGFFETSSLLPVSLAWETFGAGNGVASLTVMRARIAKYRRQPQQPTEDYTIGNIVLQQPFFLRQEAWIPVPSDFSLNIVQGKSYDLDKGSGLELWTALEGRLAANAVIPERNISDGSFTRMFSDPVLARRRLGQGGFRILVTDTYQRQCAITSEHTLPVLEAAHIKPVTQGGEHLVSNGLLLRSDIHTLFDRGYVTVTPDYKFRVSKRLNDDWRNGKIYYSQNDQRINLPSDPASRPDRQLLEWHADTIFLR